MTNQSLVLVLLISAILAAGCGSSGGHSKPTQRLGAGDFAPGGGSSGRARGTTTVPNPPAYADASSTSVVDLNAAGRDPNQSPRQPVGVTTLSAASGGISDVTGAAGAPVVGAELPARTGDPVLVDAKVGEVNGKPVYVSTFFDVGSPTLEPLGPRLAALAKTKPRTEWIAQARREIDERLNLVVQDELFRAEALASLSPEQKQGLFAFVQNLQEDLRRKGGGSREAMKRELEEREGVTADEWSRKKEQQVLVQYQLQQKVLRRINVSWRDISLAYNGRLYNQYHHPPRYRFWLITIPEDAADDRTAIESALAEGRPFPEVAASKVNRFKNDRGGLEIRELKEKETLEDAAFFPNAQLNAAAKALQPGASSDAIKVGSSLAWVHLEAIVTPPDLYNAQLEIEGVLRDQRVREAVGKYIERLAGRASVTSLPEMRAKLLQVAMERYLTPAAP